MIRDRIVCGVHGSSLRKKLLQERELTLDKCIDMCHSAEAKSTQLEAMSAQNSHAPCAQVLHLEIVPMPGPMPNECLAKKTRPNWCLDN